MPTKLDERSVRTAAPPANGAISIWDSEVRGFGLRVYARTRRNPQGAKAFFINYRTLGVERRLTIGEYPTWSALAARAEAKALRKRIDNGEDPVRKRREAREAPTVKDLAERYRREHLPRKALSSRKADWAMIEREILPVLRDRKVAGIHFGDMAALHEAITARGNPVRAKPWRDAAQANPCRGVERNQEEGREKFFSSAQLAALTDALAEHQIPAADCLRLIMMTGCRPGEAMRATWAEFDEPGFWDKPSQHTKARRRHRVPLSAAATELIAKLRNKRAGDSEFVFPGRIRGQPLRELRGCWKVVVDRAELDGARIYDLRHSFASIGAGGGLSLQIIGKLLGHTVARTTEKYAHLADDPLREAAEKIGRAIAGVGKGGNVVTLKRGGA
jgi:integrase